MPIGSEQSLSQHPPSVLVLGPNPAWQRVFRTRHLVPGQVVRGHLETVIPAGKGLNCAHAARSWGSQVFVIGGDDRRSDAAPGTPGDFGDACEALGFAYRPIPLAGAVRTCITVTCDATGLVTELVEEGPPAAPEADGVLVDLLTLLLPRVAAWAVSGSFPRGLSCEVLRPFLGKSTCIVDSTAFAMQLLEHGAEDPGLWIKLNHAEWLGIAGESDLARALERGRAALPASPLVATWGEKGCVVSLPGRQGLRHLALPPLGAPAHPIGAGDAFCGSLLHALSAGASADEALSLALAASHDSCLDTRPTRFDSRRARDRIPQIVSAPYSGARQPVEI